MSLASLPWDHQPVVGFPATRCASRAEFEAWRAANRDLLDRRYAHDCLLAAHAAEIAGTGSCAPCVTATRFTSILAGGETLEDGRRLPNWREQQVCGCPDRLSQRGRALLHFLLAVRGLPGWTRALWFGPEGPGMRRLAAHVAQLDTAPRLEWLEHAGGTALGLKQRPAQAHLAIASDYLPHVPALDRALLALAQALVPGGALVFTVPFHIEAETTETAALTPGPIGLLPAETREPVHKIGWDILDRLRGAGFGTAHVYLYWSAELGYRGSYNAIFMATR